MLNKVKTQLKDMTETLREAVKYLSSSPADHEDMQKDVAAFMQEMASAFSQEVFIQRFCAAMQENIQTTPLPLDEIRALMHAFCDEIDTQPTEYKVLFLPYYDNTWDALESVYQAFAADDMFVTEIVITPILRNTPSGEKEWIYSDYLTPMGVPHTSYNLYDIGRDLPDIVFYCNPYDSVNIPKFSLPAMRPYTTTMVYVPYYVYLNNFMLPQYHQERTKKAYALPGHYYADKVIMLGKGFMDACPKEYPCAKKMMPLGSPKIDHIVHKKNTGQWDRYPAWESVFMPENGKKKRVFMLNTHYIFGDCEKYVLETMVQFIEENPDTAMIWRPHPLSFVIEPFDCFSQEPVFRQYMDRIKDCDRIIVDRTPQAISAMLYSDVLVSSVSSLVSEWLVLDKPLFLCNTYQACVKTMEELQSASALEEVIRENQTSTKGGLCLERVLPVFAPTRVVPSEGLTLEEFKDAYLRHLYMDSLRAFLDAVQRGEDPKADQWRAYVKQNYANIEGTCGESIHAYMRQEILKTS